MMSNVNADTNRKKLDDAYEDIKKHAKTIIPDNGNFYKAAFIQLLDDDHAELKNGLMNSDTQREHIQNLATQQLKLIIIEWLIQHNYDEILSHKKTVLITKDDYGDIDSEKYVNELNNFANKRVDQLIEIIPGHIFNNIGFTNMEQIRNFTLQVFNFIGSLIVERPDALDLDETTSPYEYEGAIAAYITNFIDGWEARVTSGSGDQGADVIANNGDYKVVIQCKLYSKPVGNKAVQEVIAASNYYRANSAVVVSNNTYTTSARQLAQTSGVELLHHNQLSEFFNNLNKKEAVCS